MIWEDLLCHLLQILHSNPLQLLHLNLDSETWIDDLRNSQLLTGSDSSRFNPQRRELHAELQVHALNGSHIPFLFTDLWRQRRSQIGHAGVLVGSKWRELAESGRGRPVRSPEESGAGRSCRFDRGWGFVASWESAQSSPAALSPSSQPCHPATEQTHRERERESKWPC